MHPSRLTPARYPLSVNVLIYLLGVFLSGCSNPTPLEPLADGGTASGGNHGTIAASSGYGSASFYPLAVGNTWTYEGRGTAHVVGGPPEEDLTYAFTETHRLVGTTRFEGTPYVVEEQIHHEIPERDTGPFTYWDRLRQDRDGLFSLDTLLQEAPPLEGMGSTAFSAVSHARHSYRIDIAAWRRDGVADASLERFADRVELVREVVRGKFRREEASPEAGLELRRLVYPLRPGVNWSIRPDFPWPARVDRIEVLDTPAGRGPAYRIDINPFGDLLHEGEWVRVWFSRDGFLGYSFHFGDGTYESDESMMVTSLQIAK